MTSKYKTLQEQTWEANKALSSSGLVALTFGNVSVAERFNGVFAIKPSGVAYSELKSSDIVVLDFDGNIVEGRLRPSSDTPTHRILLSKFTHSNSIVHTHSPKAVAFAQAGVGLNCFGTTHADYFLHEVPVTRDLTREEIASDYEANTARVIVESFQDINSSSTPAVLVRGHGPFTWGEDWKKAIEHSVALELCASMALDACLLNQKIAPLCDTLKLKHHSRKHGPDAYYGQTNA